MGGSRARSTGALRHQTLLEKSRSEANKNLEEASAQQLAGRQQRAQIQFLEEERAKAVMRAQQAEAALRNERRARAEERANLESMSEAAQLTSREIQKQLSGDFGEKAVAKLKRELEKTTAARAKEQSAAQQREEKLQARIEALLTEVEAQRAKADSAKKRAQACHPTRELYVQLEDVRELLSVFETRLPQQVPELQAARMIDDATEKTVHMIRFYRRAICELEGIASADPHGITKKFEQMEEKRKKEKAEFKRQLKQTEKHAEQRVKAMEEECERRIKEELAALTAKNARLVKDAKEAVEAAKTAEAVAKEAEHLADVSAKAASGYHNAISHIAEEREELVNDLAHVNENLETVIDKEVDGYGDVIDFSRDVRARKDKVKPISEHLPPVDDPGSPKSNAPSSPARREKRDARLGGAVELQR
jgi:hypothetical protein